MTSTNADPFTLDYARTHGFQGIPTRSLERSTLKYSIYTFTNGGLDAILSTAARLVEEAGYLYHRCSGPSFRVTVGAGGHACISGELEYGDAVDDEWGVVGILLGVTRAHRGAWVRVEDSGDGEFLLVEAAHVLPRWLEPDGAANRVWLNGGRLYIIPGRRGEKLTIEGAVGILGGVRDPAALLRERDVEREAFARVEAARTQQVHHAVVKVPRTVAAVLRAVPESVAAATEAFYVRDPIAMRCLRRPRRRFEWTDTVEMEVKFTKVLYAQLKGQMWAGGDTVGEKLMAGFEMLVAKENEGLWADSEGIKKAREKVITAAEARTLPTDEEVKGWGQRNDSEDWLDIDFTEFEKDLKSGGDGAAPGTYGDVEQEEKMKRIVERFEKFLNDDEAGMEGVDLDGDDDDDDEDDTSDDDDDRSDISFDEEEFSKLMRQMMGMPPDRPLDSDMLPPDEEEKEIRKVQDAVGRELAEAGVLGTASANDQPRIKEVDRDTEGEDEPGSDDEVNVDFELVKNMLESFKSQAGLAGPGGNLLASLGIQLPRDEPEAAQQSTGEGKGKGKAVEQ